MKAMLLAAGKGTRMMPLTANCPKPLLSVGDDTLIGHHLHRLRQAGITEVVINVAYLAEQIIERIGDGRGYGLSVQFSKEQEPLETAGGINRALPLLGEAPFLLVNGDVWSDLPLRSVIDKNLACDSLGCLVLVPNPGHNLSGDFAINRGLLAAKTEGQPAYTYSGMALLRPQIIANYPKRRECFGLKEVFDWAMAKGQLAAELYQGDWLDVGTPERLEQLRARV